MEKTNTLMVDDDKIMYRTESRVVVIPQTIWECLLVKLDHTHINLSTYRMLLLVTPQGEESIDQYMDKHKPINKLI